jgi:hypothetical protein
VLAGAPAAANPAGGDEAPLLKKNGPANPDDEPRTNL